MLKSLFTWILVAYVSLLCGVGLSKLMRTVAPIPVTATAAAPASTSPAPTPPLYPITRPPRDSGAPWVPLVRFAHVDVNNASVAMAVRTIVAVNLLGADYIVLEISSPGGDVDAGQELARTIEMSPAPVHCVVDGEAQSMATYILQSCDARSMTRRSYLMIHEPMIWVEGWQRTRDSENQASHTRHFTDAFLQQYHRLKISVAQVRKLVEHGQNWYLSADEALKVGAVDSIVDSVDQVRHSYSHALRRNP